MLVSPPPGSCNKSQNNQAFHNRNLFCTGAKLRSSARKLLAARRLRGSRGNAAASGLQRSGETLLDEAGDVAAEIFVGQAV